MKKIVKFISLLSAVLLVAGSFAGCGGKKDEVAVQTDGKNFTYWTMMDGYSQATIRSYSDMLFYQEMEKRTGIHIDFIHPIQGSTGNEAFIAMLTSEKFPDMVEWDWAAYTGGPQQAIDDGFIVKLNDYLEEYAPNYYDNLEGEKGKENNYQYKLQASTDEGSYYGFNILNIGSTKGFAGLYVRGDKLSEWNMKVPQTIDDWTAFFAKAKASGFEKPFTCTLGVLSFKSTDEHSFNTAFGVGKYFYLQGKEVVFAPFEKGYKEYMTQIAQWTKDGYIDTGFVTNDSAKIEGYIANGISAAAYGFVGSGLGKILPAAQAKNPDFDLVACPYPVANEGEIAEFQMVYPEATTKAIAITTDCGNLPKAMEWCDYIYSEEGMILQLFGVEGDTFTVEERDGEIHYVYTDKIKNHEGTNSVTESLYKYMLPCNHPGYNQHPDYLDGYYPYESQKDAIKVWNESSDKAKLHRLPPLSQTDDELSEITDIEEIARPQLEVAMCDMILGKKSIDDYDDVIAKAKADGYDRVLELKQAAYDRYLSKM